MPHILKYTIAGCVCVKAKDSLVFFSFVFAMNLTIAHTNASGQRLECAEKILKPTLELKEFNSQKLELQWVATLKIF